MEVYFGFPIEGTWPWERVTFAPRVTGRRGSLSKVQSPFLIIILRHDLFILLVPPFVNIKSSLLKSQIKFIFLVQISKYRSYNCQALQ